jgi:hypothetical protein
LPGGTEENLEKPVRKVRHGDKHNRSSKATVQGLIFVDHPLYIQGMEIDHAVAEAVSH